ncbi:MAG: hypothetical protein ACKVHU_07335 [Acidimicrobiales bacterium]|jgi:hypothetical protein
MTTDTPSAASVDVDSQEQAQRGFSTSIIVSAVRCTLTYVVLPFLTPFIGFLDSVGPVLGLIIGAVAIVANVFSIRRFWRAQHPWRKPITVLHVGMIVLLSFLMVEDLIDVLN